METFLENIKEERKELKKNKVNFWGKNKRDNKKNIKRIIDAQELPQEWKLHIIVSQFLSDKKIFPFHHDSWSSVNLITATEKQGFEVVLFINKARAEFLSAPALIPLVIHETQHVKQAASDPERFIKATTNNDIAQELEIEAERVVAELPEEFRKQYALESILYCYDIGGWRAAERMADFLYKDSEDMYGGGYTKSLSKEEYSTFSQAKNNKNINIFIDFFE